MQCRKGCAACCVAISISSEIPGMPQGKRAGERCVQLSDENLCRIFGRAERPDVCLNLMPDAQMCGSSDREAFEFLSELERLTSPGKIN